MAPEGAGLLAVEAALRRILEGAAPLEAENVPFHAAAGRVLARPVIARLTQPPFDASAMDGYAVRAADAAVGARLEVIGQSAAGHAFEGKARAGEAVRIFTGAPMPDGADSVLIQENATREGEGVTVNVAVETGQNVRPAGFDFKAGDTLIAPGVLITPRHIALAAAGGRASFEVVRRPKVAILATGDELVAPGTTPEPSQIVSSTPPALAAMVTAAGGAPGLLGIARDTLDDLARHLARSRDADVVVTIGGASVGDHDLVHKALEAQGVALDFWKIAMRPGKPMMFGRRGGQRFIGLPGNPVSALICAEVFLMPLVRRLGGGTAETALRQVKLGAAIEANGPRKHFMRAKIVRTADGAETVAPLSSQDSSLLYTLAHADALIVREPGASAAGVGAPVDVMGFGW
ncbi:MAG: molybdopterin molybdotransferase MoeA [Hyphomicrobiaceae bacterium]